VFTASSESGIEWRIDRFSGVNRRLILGKDDGRRNPRDHHAIESPLRFGIHKYQTERLFSLLSGFIVERSRNVTQALLFRERGVRFIHMRGFGYFCFVSAKPRKRL